MRLSTRIFLLCSAGLLGSGAALRGQDHVLADNGRTAYRVGVSAKASVAERHAAEELASFLTRITGATFALVPLDTRPASPMLIVGSGPAARSLLPDLDPASLTPDGIVIQSVGENIVFAGARPRGTLYAVYSFLQDVVGCRWWSSTVSTIPSRKHLTVPRQAVRYIPPLEYRETFWFDAFDPDWAVRNKSNGNREHLDKKRGGHITYKGFVHTFNSLVPPGKYFALHPEWFSEINGKRLGGANVRSQLCLTNPELQDFVTKRVLQWLHESPEASIVSVSQNDWGNPCHCARCAALAAREGSESGPMLHFVNTIAERVEKEFPHVAISTLAYQYTRKPPRYVRPRPNVIVRLCSIECSFAHPLGDSVENAAFRRDIEGWSKVCQRLYIWDYTTNFSHYIMPHPNLRVLGPNIRFFVQNGVKGVFEQGAYQSPGAEFAELRAWVLAQLLWDPGRDADALISEFLAGYYGAAAPYLRRYIDLLHDECERTGHYLGIGSPPSAPFFTLAVMTQAEKLFDQAEAAVAGDPAVLDRVRVARMPLRYVWALRWQDFRRQAKLSGVPWEGPSDYTQNCRQFYDLGKQHGFTKLSEGVPFDGFARRTIQLKRGDSPVPANCRNLPPEQWIDLQDVSGRLWREGTGSALKTDPKASDGVAAWMPGTHHEWAYQQALGIAGVPTKPGPLYTVYADIRCELSGHEGLAFSYGLYDVRNRVEVTSHGVTCAEITSPDYTTYKIGTFPLHTGMYLWVAPPANPDNVKAVWVDRVWLVREPKP